MTAAPLTIAAEAGPTGKPDSIWRHALRSGRIMVGGFVLGAIVLCCVLTMPLTLDREAPLYFDEQFALTPQRPPDGQTLKQWFGTDALGRSILARCLLGGTISLAVGVAAATLSVLLGVTVGLVAGYHGGWIDHVLMRAVDILYGLPYILLVIMFKVAFEEPLKAVFSPQTANLVVLFSAIGLVSWLTMARVVRGQVLSLRGQPFIEAARAMGLPETRIFLRHVLPNLVGPITVYATLTIPQAILQESFLSFLGVGINPPLPTWGSLASENLVAGLNPIDPRWWMVLFPCILLAVTLLSLNFVGDGLRDLFDPRKEAAKL